MSFDKNMCIRLEDRMKSLASSHFQYIENNNNSEENSNKASNKLRKEDFVNFVDKLCQSQTNHNLGKLDVELLKCGVKELVECSDKIFQCDIDIFYVPQEKSVEEFVPLVYAVLTVIYSQTNQFQRQYCFHRLLECYYDQLKECLLKIDISLPSILSRDCYEHQAKQYIPYVKLEMARQCLDNLKKPHRDQSITLEFIQELTEYFQYPNFLREDCYVVVKNKLKSTEFNFKAYQLKAISERLGFLGDYYKLKISTENNTTLETFQLFAKYLPTTNETTRDIASLSFNKERFIYQTFIPKLNQLGFKDITDFAPECYFARTNDVLVLNDVSTLRYSSSDIHTPANYDWLSIASKQLAKFHACSLLYEEKLSQITGQRVRLDQKYGVYLKEINFTPEKSGMVMLRGARTVIEFFLEKFPVGKNGPTPDNLRRKVEETFNRMFRVLAEPTKFRNVICHGDMWGSNILMRTGKDGEPNSCLLIDYQLTRYCSPALDLLFLFYTNTDKETRRKYMDTLMKYYFEELSRILKKYNFDLNDIYDQETFLESCGYFRSTAVCQAACYLQILLCPKDQMKKINDCPEKSSYFYLVDRKGVFNEAMEYEPFRNRMEEIVEELYEVCESSC